MNSPLRFNFYGFLLVIFKPFFNGQVLLTCLLSGKGCKLDHCTQTMEYHIISVTLTEGQNCSQLQICKIFMSENLQLIHYYKMLHDSSDRKYIRIITQIINRCTEQNTRPTHWSRKESLMKERTTSCV